MLAWKNESSVPTSRQYPFSRSSWPGTTFCEKSYTLATPESVSAGITWLPRSVYWFSRGVTTSISVCVSNT